MLTKWSKNRMFGRRGSSAGVLLATLRIRVRLGRYCAYGAVLGTLSLLLLAITKLRTRRKLSQNSYRKTVPWCNSTQHQTSLPQNCQSFSDFIFAAHTWKHIFLLFLNCKIHGRKIFCCCCCCCRIRNMKKRTKI